MAASPIRADTLRSGLLISEDGAYQGAIEANWNWPFARRLLDAIAPRPAGDPFVALWYHATAAYLLRNSFYGEAQPHLTHAAPILPDDPRILFDRACLAEALGLPRAQQFLTDESLAAMRITSPDPRPVRAMPRGQFGIPPVEVANADAERFFRRVLEIEPGHVEARVRLARLLDLRNRHDEADRELAVALPSSRDPIVTFFARLFAGRAARALGRLDDAGRHFREAAALFPDAQSVLLAESQLALLQADTPGAVAPVRRLSELPVDAAQRSDPWWRYHTGPGPPSNLLDSIRPSAWIDGVLPGGFSRICSKMAHFSDLTTV